MGYKIGDLFDPSYKICGFYPPDIVGRRTDLTDGQKRLYDRGVRWAGRNAVFWCSFEFMGRELGKSPRQLKRDMAQLQKLGLIRRQRRGKRQSNVYSFVYHSMFESSRSTSGGGSPASHHSFQGEVTDLGGEGTSTAPGDGPPMSHEFRHLNYVNRITSSSPRKKPEYDSETPITDEGTNTKSSSDQWTAAALERAADLLREHFRTYSLDANALHPDSAILRKVLSHFTSLEDFELYNWALTRKHLGGIRSYGFYATDAASWPERRSEVARLRAEIMAELAEANPGSVPGQRHRQTAIPDEFDFVDFFERCYARHPKKGRRSNAERYLSGLLFREVQPEEFERMHAAWCESDAWQAGGGRYVKQDLSEWILDKGWRYEPPTSTIESMSDRAAAQAMERMRKRG